MKRELIRRGFNAEIRADEAGNIIEGKPIIFNSQTDICGKFGEIIEPGALDDADLSDVRLCKNHDTSNVFARFKKGREGNTMNLIPVNDGLDIDATLDTEGNPLAATLYSEVKRGDISGMSFMFSVAEDEWEENDTYPIRHITKIGSVIEVSAVTFPAYEATEISARDEEAAEAALEKAAEAAKKSNENKAEAALELERAKIKNRLM